MNLAEGLHWDCETRSAADLRKTGPWTYSEHWSTDVWCFAYALAHNPVGLWWPGDPVPPEILYAIEHRLPFAAHNAGFEEAIVTNVMAPRYGWPIPAYEQWACTAAMGAAMAIPRALDKAAIVMGMSERKDNEGHDLMMRMARPRSKNWTLCALCGRMSCDHHEMFRRTLTWWDDDDRKRRLGAYCMQDVRTERALCDVLHMLPGDGSALAPDMWKSQ